MRTVKQYFQTAKQFVKRHQFLSAISLAIFIALFMTSVSMTLYVLSGASGLDLSRPGFSSVRKTISNEAESTFTSTGNLSESDIAAFRKLYQKQRDKLQGLGAFNDDALSDESLGFVLPEPTDTGE